MCRQISGSGHIDLIPPEYSGSSIKGYTFSLSLYGISYVKQVT